MGKTMNLLNRLGVEYQHATSNIHTYVLNPNVQASENDYCGIAFAIAKDFEKKGIDAKKKGIKPQLVISGSHNQLDSLELAVATQLVERTKNNNNFINYNVLAGSVVGGSIGGIAEYVFNSNSMSSAAGLGTVSALIGYALIKQITDIFKCYKFEMTTGALTSANLIVIDGVNP